MQELLLCLYWPEDLHCGLKAFSVNEMVWACFHGVSFLSNT